jgi:hypothetical protein
MATNTSSTNNKDTDIRSGAPTNNRGTAVEFATGYHSSQGAMRGLLAFSLPADPGGTTITKISCFLYQIAAAVPTGQIDMHRMTRDFVEGQATWNIYSTGNSWTTAGGDYDATILDSNTDLSDNTRYEFVIRGTGATNSYDSLTWGDTIGLLFKKNTESGASVYADFASKEATTAGNRPYLEITYTEGATGDSKMLLLF